MALITYTSRWGNECAEGYETRYTFYFYPTRLSKLQLHAVEYPYLELDDAMSGWKYKY